MVSLIIVNINTSFRDAPFVREVHPPHKFQLCSRLSLYIRGQDAVSYLAA